MKELLSLGCDPPPLVPVYEDPAGGSVRVADVEVVLVPARALPPAQHLHPEHQVRALQPVESLSFEIDTFATEVFS